jgi:mRNA degradation ribonuclease J1/J2
MRNAIILDKYKCEEIEEFKHIKKLENAFLNAQQMSIQQVVHICLSIQLYNATRLFQFINICEENNRVFVLLPKKIKQIISKFNRHPLQITKGIINPYFFIRICCYF